MNTIEPNNIVRGARQLAYRWLAAIALCSIFFVGARPSLAVPLRVDFNSTTQDGPAHNEAGFSAYDAQHEVAGSFVTQNYGVNFSQTGPGSVSVTPAWPNTTDNRVQQAIDRSGGNDANWLGNNLDLLTDWLGSDTRTGGGGNGDFDGTTGTPTYLTLTLGGVPAGTYHWRSYHHDTEHMHTLFTIELSTDGGSSFTEVHSGQMTDSTPGGSPDSGALVQTGSPDPDPANLPSTANFDFASLGGDVILRFTPLALAPVHQQFFGINGFELEQLSGPLSDGLVNYWPLDSDLIDCAELIDGSASSVADDGTFDGLNGTGGISFGSGLFGSGIDQDGSAGPAQNNGHVRIDRSADTLFGANATNPGSPNTVTTSMWVQVSGFDINWQTMLSHGEGGQYRIARRAGAAIAAYAGGSGDIPNPPAGPAIGPANGWHHLLAISEGGVNTRLYVDGGLVDTGGVPTIDDNRSGGTLNLLIGGNPDTGAQNREFWGQIDDVAQWNRALSDLEIAQLWGGGPANAVALKELLQPKIGIYCGSKGPIGNIYSQDFDFTDGTTDLGDGTQMNGTANIQGNQLELTRDGVAGGSASFNIPGLECASNGWSASFDLTIIDGPAAAPPADGMGFNWGNFGLAELGAAEEGMGGIAGVTDNLSFEIDTWMNFDGEQGVNIAEVSAGTDNNLAFTNGPILNDGTTVSGQVTMSWDPVNGASYSTTGLLTNAAFSNFATTLAASDTHLFGLSGRVGGANETKLIDNLHIETVGDPLVTSGASTPFDFGMTCPGTPLSKEFTIANLSSGAALLLGTPTLPADWSIVGTVPASIPAGGQVTITVQFDATGPGGVVGGTVAVPNNDSGADPYTFNVTAFMDATPPVIFCSGNIVANAPAGGSAFVSFAHIVAVDDVDGPVAVSFTPDDSAAFPIGSTPITATAVDACGNTTTVMFDVVVLEVQATPLLRAPDSISLRGDAVPGGGTATVGGVGTPAALPASATIYAYNNAFLNNASQLVFEATLTGAGTNNLAVFSNASGALETIGVKNTASPSGSNYLLFNEMAIEDSGVSAFESRTAAGDSHVTDDGTATTLQVGSPAPGLAGDPLVESLSTPALSSSGLLYSPARLELGTGTPAVTVSDDSMIWDSNNGPVAREGEPAQGLPSGINYSHLSNRVVANDSGEVAFSGNLTGAGSARTAVWSGLPTSLTVAARRDDPADGAGGATFASFQAESISPTGAVVLRATLKSGGVTSANNEGLWTDRSGSLLLVAREGEPAPCGQPDVHFGRFTSMFIDADGRIVFHAFLKGLAVNSTSDGSVWRSNPDGSLDLIAREGDLANNTDGAVYAKINVVATNNSDGVLILASLVKTIGDTTSKNFIGLWRDRGATDPAPLLVMRRGDTVEIDGQPQTVSSLDISYVTNPAGGTGGYGRVLNDSGTAVLKLSLTGNNGGVFTMP